MAGSLFFEAVLNGLTIGMVYVLVAIGLSIIFGVMDVLNVAHGELLALGAYVSFSVITQFGPDGFWLSIVAVPLLVGLVGMGIERLLIRRLYGRGHLSHVLLTFGLLLIIYDLKWLIWGKSSKLYPLPPAIDTPIELFGFGYSLYNYTLILLGALLVAMTWALLNYTNFGLVIRGGSQDRGMVRNLGIKIDRHYTLVFGYGAALAAFGGVVLGGYQNVNLEMGNTVLIPAFVIVVLGGLGSFRGAIVGSLAVGLAQSFVSIYFTPLQGYTLFLIMIGVLLVRPKGLFGASNEGAVTDSVDDAMLSGDVKTTLDPLWRRRIGLFLVAVLALAPLGVGVVYTSYIQFLLNELLIWLLFAMSIDVILGYGGLISLGHALFYGVGAYTAMLVFLHLSPSVLVVLAAAILVTAVVAWVTGHLALRVSGVYFVMITLAFAELAYSAVRQLDVTGGSNGLFGVDPFYGIAGIGFNPEEVDLMLGPVPITGDTVFYYFMLATVVAAFLVTRRVMDAPFGRVLRSIRESESRARFIGYDTKGFKRQAYVLSGVLAGISGAMFSIHQGYATPSVLHWVKSGNVVIVAVLGGVGTLYGPMLGATVFVAFERVVSSYVSYWRLILGVIFVLTILYLPNGLVSVPEKIQQFRSGDGSTRGPPSEADAPETEVDD